MSYSRMVLEQIKAKAKLELINEHRSQRPEYQNILDDAVAMHEQSSTASSLNLPTRAQLDAYSNSFGPDGEVAKRRERASNFTDSNAATQSTVRSMANKLKGAENLSADDVFDYERGLGSNLPAVTNPGKTYRKTLEFGDQLRQAIPGDKRSEFDAEYGSMVPGVTLGLDDVGTIYNAIDTVDSVGKRDASDVGKEFVRKAARAAGDAAAAQRDNKVQSTLSDYGVTNDMTPDEQVSNAKRAGAVAAVETMRTSQNRHTKAYGDQLAANPKYIKGRDIIASLAKRKAPDVIDKLLSLDPNVDTNNVGDAINKYVPKRQQARIKDSLNTNIINPNVNAVQDYIKQNPPSRLTRGSSEYGYRETLRRMGK